jgi:hypothetical protein
MNTYQNTLAKLNKLSEPLLQEVNNFIDSLLLQQTQTISPKIPTDNINLSQDPDTFNLMQLAEIGFSEWNDPEEDIYWT